MKPQAILRILAGLSLLIFFCPFFQMCSDDLILENNTKTKEEFNIKEDDTENAYQLSIFRVLDWDNQQYVNWPDLFFTVIILSSIIVFIESTKSYSYKLRFFCYLNIIMALGFVLFTFTALILNDIRQIKYGFYLFLLNTIVIIVLNKKVLRENEI